MLGQLGETLKGIGGWRSKLFTIARQLEGQWQPLLIQYHLDGIERQG